MLPRNGSNLDTQEAAWQAVCHADDLIPGMGVCARAHGHQIAIFLTDEGLFALDNLDPFSQAAILARGLVCDLKGRMVVASPMYKQHFCLQTGLCIEDESMSVHSWPLRRDAGGMISAAMPLPLRENGHACA
ncbi:nitrite reductase small subunit NirD [Pusillimonas noertemannii]|uniref:Assimilatory nitrite reductase (NAD(P)H) small subunit n=1 Tax=Pusillimonas noertemannii TaxID=305977 RepID=A0A2U1CM14_9BURK|nr:nitrite reductase small subunit NirD [Pusillimonas noertemannii]NYT68924.1 nitrite reductase small subunit NirD [Pusillimonas noertemannii]PVY62056.1 assimilatory nitrite reductase (NAD(P)H) small subunit [Pusillimonas noertemannii]TFL10945.1 nitrite reductase small subunit NirD [Pusillimonas noertemannii]